MKNSRILGILISVLMVITMIPSFTFAAELPFTDVAADAWYYGDVKEAYDTGLINGMTATTFEPESNMTYAQAVKLAACMNQKYTTGSVTLVNGTVNWWDTYLDYAKTHNIINKDYSWNSNATRAGYVEIFAKALPDEALKVKNSIADGYIPDVGMTHPQSAAIYKLYRAGILTGMDERGNFEPNSNIKRSEVSAILTRMMNESARRELTLGPGTFQIFFNSTGGGAVETQEVTVNGKAAKPADPTRKGYSFAGWYRDSGLTVAYDFTETVTSDLTLYAKWKEIASSVNEYTVTFNTNGGSTIPEQKVKINEKATKPADPSRDGYSFVSWYKDSGFTTSYDFTTAVTDNLMLYAKWIEEKGTIKDNWEDIIASVNDETYKSKYKVGDTKSLDLGPEGVVEMQIAAFDADELADGSGKMAAITWISKQMLKSDHRMNPYNTLKDPEDSSKYKIGTGPIGGWEHSEMRDWLQSDIKKMIQSKVRDAIKPVVKYSYSYSGDSTNSSIQNAVTTDDIWIPSWREVYGTYAETWPESSGPIYGGLFVINRDRIKNKNGVSIGWWSLRTADDDVGFFCVNNGDGSYGILPAGESGGVVLCFCI